MTEITRVPIQPIAKGSLVKLWLGLLAAVVLGAGIAWAAVPGGVEVDTLTEGTGPTPGPTDVVFVKYVGKLANGTEFDRSQPLPPQVQGLFPEGMAVPMSQSQGMIEGFREALADVQKGGRYVWYIPAKKAYGANPQPGGPIPPNADLTFEVEITDIMKEADVQQRIQVLQQMMQQQQGAPGPQGAPGAPPVAPPANPDAPQ